MADREDYTTADPTNQEINGMAITPDINQTNASKEDYLLDREWIKQAFLVDDSKLVNGNDITNRYWSSASVKFTDSRLGGNIGINARPQFTRYSDSRVKGRLSSRTDVSLQNTGGDYGMGRYYSEAIDDNSQTIYLRMGVPQYSSLMSFFSKAFDANLTTLARTGRGLGLWYNIGLIAGTVATVTAFPAISATIITGKALSAFFTRKTSKFYTLKPTMHLYWSTVNMLANTIAINKGIMPRILDDAVKDQAIGNPYKLDQEYLSSLHKAIPDMFTDDNGYDIFAVANKAQRTANSLFMNDYENFNNGSATDYTGKIKKSYQDKVTTPAGEPTLINFINKFLMFGYYVKSESDNRMELDPKSGDKPPDKDGFGKFFDAEFRQGSQFAVFKVDHTGSVQESFNNAAVESDLSNKFNSTSSQAREAKFTFAEGNISDGAIGSAVQGVIGAAGDLAKGAIDGMTFGMGGSIMGLAGSGFIDIPKHWQSSSAQLPRSSYTMQLISPYGNPISQMQNIFIPLSMILAAALPLSAGKQSYTSPFLVQLYDRGRCQVQLGMIDSVSIVRGTCNLPFTNRGKVMAIDVTFSITDLSSIMHMPLSTGSLFGADMTLDEDNILMDYLAVLAGQDMYSQIYAMPKAKLALAKKIRQVEKLTSPAYWASWLHEETTTGMLPFLLPLEDWVAGSSIVTNGGN